MIGFTLTYLSGLVMLTKIVSEETKPYIALIIIAPPVTAFGILVATKLFEAFMDWWCARSIAMHKQIVLGLAAFVTTTMIGLFSYHLSSNGKSR
jgi:hypothetical protein